MLLFIPSQDIGQFQLIVQPLLNLESYKKERIALAVKKLDY